MPEPNHVSWRDAGLRSFVHNHIVSNREDQNNSLVLADYLQDHEDPRAEIARRHGEIGDSGEMFNPEGKRLYVKSYESYIPLTPSDKTPGWLPFQSVRVHVYGVNPGKERPRSRNWRLEEHRKQASVPVAVRLAFDVTDNQNAGGNRKSGEWGGWFAPHEAVRLANRFHPETAAAIKKVIAEGFGGKLPSEEPPAEPLAHPDDIDHNVPMKTNNFSESKYDDAVALAAYAHLRATGDHAACKRLRKLVCGEAEEFADPTQEHVPEHDDPNGVTPSTHDLLFKSVLNGQEQGDATPLGVYADHLQEEGFPGAHLARAGMHARGYRPDPDTVWGIPNAEEGIQYHVDSGNVSVYPRETDKGNYHLHVVHTSPVGRAYYYVPLQSREHLNLLTSDLDHNARSELMSRVGGLFDGNNANPQQFADPPAPGGKPKRTRAPKSPAASPPAPPTSPSPPPAFNPNRPSSSTLAALLKQARVDPENTAGHGMIADQLDEEHPGNKISELIRKQYGLGEHGGRGSQEPLYHDPFYAGYDGTHPYAARIGRHGPFDLYLLHDELGRDSSNPSLGNPTGGNHPRWVLRAASRLPGSNDVSYNFEIPHERAHEIPQMFPAVAQQGHINPAPHILSSLGSINASPTFNVPTYLRARDAEANQFDQRMDAEQRARE